MPDDISLFEMAWDEDDVKNVVDSVTRGSYWANGPYVDEFEDSLARYHDVEHAVVFNSGTTALVSALEAAGVGSGDEVLVPSFTFISTANAVRLVGGEPVFVDIDYERYGLNPSAVTEAITEDTAAVVPVHYAGKPARIHEIADIADAYDLTVIEDAAESFGARAEGDTVCTVGNAGMLSFCQNKVITTGEGGAIVTDDDDLARDLELVRSHGRASGEYFDSASGGEYVSLGNNFRMADVVASIGVAQMEKAEHLIERRRSVADEYAARLADVGGVTVPEDPPSGRHVYQLYTVTFDDPADRDAAIETLSDRGIGSKVYFEPAHESRYYRENPARTGDLSTTVDVSSRVLSLPMHPGVTSIEVERVAEAVAEALDAD
jgi:perosamine synthetase